MLIHTVEPAYHPNSKMSFLAEWLVTMKCNYDCAYCSIGPLGHDNSTQHPSVEKSLIMLDQIYSYVDVVMAHKKPASKDVVMHLLGGEVIYHPQIILLMKQSSERYQKYKDNWNLKRRLTTNGTATPKKWELICQHFEGIPMSYHSTGPDKLKKCFKTNLLHLNDIKKEHDLIVLMYPHKDHWKDCIEFLRWAKENNINARPKILDGPLGVYNKEHLKDLSEFLDPEELVNWDTEKRADHQARACCGGRRICFNRNLKNHKVLVPREPGFKGWHCSANQFFLHGNNVTGLYYTNHDCSVRLDRTRGPLADIQTMPAYIQDMKKQTVLPTLVCAQDKCQCGVCAPKSMDKERLMEIMKIYNKPMGVNSATVR